MEATIVTARILPVASARGDQAERDALEQDLEGELPRAAATEEVDGEVKVDIVARGEDESALRVVPGSLELLAAPALDPIDLGDVNGLELCRRHDALPFDVGYSAYSLLVLFDVWDVPFMGGFRKESVKIG